jgi:quercetin dioxygenase-like cupin family protein
VTGGGWLVAVGDWLAMMLPGNRDRGGRERHGVEAEMETVNGATVILPEAGEAAADVEREPVVFGPSRNQEAYVVMVGSMPVGDPAPPLHRHPHTDEAFYIAEGQLTFHLGDRELVAGAGAFVFIPRGLVHTAWNSGSGPMRGLLLLSPGGAEHIFQSVETASHPARAHVGAEDF